MLGVGGCIAKHLSVLCKNLLRDGRHGIGPCTVRSSRNAIYLLYQFPGKWATQRRIELVQLHGQYERRQ